MKIFRSSVVAALILMAGIAGWGVSAMAQEDKRFFGRWEPSSTSAGGWPLIIEPGRFYNINDKGEIVDEEHYQVIRDFGDRVLIKIWPLKPAMEGASTDPSLEIWIVTEGPPYVMRLSETRTIVITEGPPSQKLEIDYCGGIYTEAYFFSDDDLEKTWARIVAWSDQKGEFPDDLHKDVNRCAIEWIDGKVTLPEASGMGFYRELEQK